jgi:hypothetical protein
MVIVITAPNTLVEALQVTLAGLQSSAALIRLPTASPQSSLTIFIGVAVGGMGVGGAGVGELVGVGGPVGVHVGGHVSSTVGDCVSFGTWVSPLGCAGSDGGPRAPQASPTAKSTIAKTIQMFFPLL